MKCPICGAENPEGKKFCGDCGAMIQLQEVIKPSDYRMRWIRSHTKAFAGIVVAITLVVVSVIVLSPFTPTYHATLHLTLWTNSSTSFSLYVDGHLVKKGQLNAGDTMNVDATVSWKGTLIHECSIRAIAEGMTAHSQTLTVDNGMTITTDFYIWY